MPYVIEDRSFARCQQRLLSHLVTLDRALAGGFRNRPQALLSRFCESLVDYLSVGHFRVFARVPLPVSAYAALEASTEAGMAFIDRFSDRFGDSQPPAAELRAGLEQLAGVLSMRLELEDDLLRLEAC